MIYESPDPEDVLIQGDIFCHSLLRLSIDTPVVTTLSNTIHTLDGTEDGLWAAAATRVPFSYKWLRRSVSLAAMDSEFGHFAQWIALREHVLPTDRICPFIINPDSLAMRKGYVVIRAGKPMGRSSQS